LSEILVSFSIALSFGWISPAELHNAASMKGTNAWRIPHIGYLRSC
jgi:hypothetical protein